MRGAPMIDLVSLDILVFTATAVTTDWVVFFGGEVLTGCLAGFIAVGADFFRAAILGLILADLMAFGAGFFAADFLGAGFLAATGRFEGFNFPAGFFFAATDFVVVVLARVCVPLSSPACWRRG